MNGPIPHGTPPAAYAGGAAAPSPAAAAARDLELDMLDMMPMRTTAVGAADEGGGAAGLVEGAVEGKGYTLVQAASGAMPLCVCA